jgi:multicomponent Na+:H+ antiporter subunit A
VLLSLLALHALLAGIAAPAARRLGRGVFWLCGLAPLATVVAVALRAPAVLAGDPVVETVTWVPGLGLGLDLRLDAFALVLVALVSGVGVLVFAYSARYFSPRADVGLLAANLVGFAGAMLGLVLAENLFVLYVFWELTSVTSYLLIGHAHEQGSARAAALQALLTTSAGGLVMLAGFVLLAQAAGTATLSALLADPPTGGVATAGALLALVGAFTKSAQVPFHTWLPGAMAAPTPVSAYLHSATMVKAGVYLIARLAPALLVGWRPLVLAVGVATMLVGGYRALRQHDLKLLLAHGTVSQLGFLVVLFGAGTEAATHAGVVLLIAHAAFKATLFLVVGVIDHQAGTRDLRTLSGLGRRLPGVAAVATVAALSMAGLPPLLGFVAKEAAFEAFLGGGADGGLGALGPAVLAGIVAGSVLTTAYTARFLWGAFARKPHEQTRAHVGAQVPRPSALFAAPAGLLAAAGLVLGVAPFLVDRPVGAATRALVPGAEPEHLALWHGFGVPLLLSVVAVGGGLALFAARKRVGTWQDRRQAPVGATAAYSAAIRGLNRVADAVTRTLQNGSLPVYLSVVLLTAVLLPASSLLRLDALPLPETFAESGLQAVVGAGITLAALGVAAAQRRFAAVLLLGAVSFGVALLFVLQGAPDLALTQLLVETLILVVFVLVLRHLPDRSDETPWRLGRGLRVLVSGLVGVFMAVFALAAAGVRQGLGPVSDYYLAEAYPQAEGRNVVNVILVDFRGMDTLGEITVLCVAALGIAGLVRACRRDRRATVESESPAEVEVGQA